jgi:hypothetical protein
MKITPFALFAIALCLSAVAMADEPRCVPGEQACFAVPHSPAWNAWECNTRKDESTCSREDVCQWDAATTACKAK